MDLAGSPLYTSGTFWAIVGVAAVLLIGIATIWVTLRVANPKRRLYYSMPVSTPLINRRPDLPPDIEVRRAGNILANPHLLSIELTSKGRQDIARQAFDGEPLRLDVGAPIVECLTVTTSPSDRPDRAWTTDGSALLIGPSHLGKRQTTVFSLLVDGPSPDLRKPQQTLLDVDIRHRDPERSARINSILYAVAGALIAGLAAAIAALIPSL